MTSVRTRPTYEDHLTYPMVICHRIVEVEGRVINSWFNNQPHTLTQGEYQSLQDRITLLETKLSKYENG